MSLKTLGAKIFAAVIHNKTQKWATNPVATQQQVFAQLLAKAKDTQFGNDHGFKGITTYQQFAAKVPVRD